MPRRSKLQLFRNLPSEIVIDILSRLPIRTIVICKCVCRSWRDLLLTRDFVDFHLSKSVPGLVIGDGFFDFGPKDLKVYEFDDELGLEHHDLHYKPLTRVEAMELTGSSDLQGSANGLALLHRRTPGKCDAFYICNPITREYIELVNDRVVFPSTAIVTYGFGVSRMTGQYKVVRILHDHNDCHARTWQNVTMAICLVYTLGTGMWRSITLPAPFKCVYRPIGICLNGNLHWLVEVLDVSGCILCFDLETETFSTFSLPIPLMERFLVGLVVLRDCLCVSDNTSEDEVVIWLLKEYGDEKSWTKEFVIRKSPYDDAVDSDFFECDYVNPIKVFKDGDILMTIGNMYMVYYSNKAKSIKHCELFGDNGDNGYDYVPEMKAMLHTSSFFPLSSFVKERVSRC